MLDNINANMVNMTYNISLHSGGLSIAPGGKNSWIICQLFQVKTFITTSFPHLLLVSVCSTVGLIYIYMGIYLTVFILF